MAERRKRRAFLVGASAAAVGGISSSLFHSSNPVLDGTQRITFEDIGGTVLNDISELSATPVHQHTTFSHPPGKVLRDALRAQLVDAKTGSRAVNVGAARHSMGGQAIPRDGNAITFKNDYLQANIDDQTYRVHAGARWSDVVRQLDPLGFSPKVMQANNDFGIASTYCVNAHGWAVPHGPMGSTVVSVNMVLPDGSDLTCSRDKNKELFYHAMGGYGLTGLITDLQVEMVPNQRLSPNFIELDSSDFHIELQNVLQNPNVSMAYGRLNIDRLNFMKNALLVSYGAHTDQSDLPAVAIKSRVLSKTSRYLLRGQLGNERVKRWRWGMENDLLPKIANKPVTRNSLMNDSFAHLNDRDPNRTDILHEYFVSFDQFPEFIKICRETIPASYQELLNITLRYVDADSESWLNYAPVPRIAAVMLFSQEKTNRAEADMARMTRALIDRVIDIGGSYYLPYRPHATVEQFSRSYPRAEEFASFKRKIDPELNLRNALWDNYLDKL